MADKFDENAPSLEVEFLGETREVEPPGTLSFGRVADLVIDDNPFLHRVLGLFSYRQGLWWLSNVGSRIRIEVVDYSSASLTTIQPSSEMPLHFPEALVRFAAGKSRYQLSASVNEMTFEAVAMPRPVEGAETITVSNLPMTRDQMRLVLALAEPALLDPFAREFRLPSNRQAAHRLGWTLTRFNRKLDNVCEKLAKRGVPGLRGDVAELAVDRRRRLVEYAIEVGLVGPDQLKLLEDGD